METVMNQQKIVLLAAELYAAIRECQVVDPLTEREPDISIENAYAISTGLLQMRKADGEKFIGKKLG
jgi:2-oxopent-4-enoate/cis-2-oxohex-4-enoate hydratase